MRPTCGKTRCAALASGGDTLNRPGRIELGGGRRRRRHMTVRRSSKLRKRPSTSSERAGLGSVARLLLVIGDRGVSRSGQLGQLQHNGIRRHVDQNHTPAPGMATASSTRCCVVIGAPGPPALVGRGIRHPVEKAACSRSGSGRRLRHYGSSEVAPGRRNGRWPPLAFEEGTARSPSRPPQPQGCSACK